MYISKVESWTSPDSCGKISRMRRGSIIPDFVKLQIQGQNVGNMVASRSKTSKQNLTVVVTAAVSVETISVGPVSESVAMPISSVVVRLRLSLSLPLAVVETMSVTIGPVAKSVVATIVAAQSIAIGPVVSIGIGIGLRLGLSLPLAVVKSMAVTVGPVAKSVVATVVAAKAVAVGPVVSIGIGLRLGSGESRKGKCQNSLHLSSATFCDKPSH